MFSFFSLNIVIYIYIEREISHIWKFFEVALLPLDFTLHGFLTRVGHIPLLHQSLAGSIGRLGRFTPMIWVEMNVGKSTTIDKVQSL